MTRGYVPTALHEARRPGITTAGPYPKKIKTCLALQGMCENPLEKKPCPEGMRQPPCTKHGGRESPLPDPSQ